MPNKKPRRRAAIVERVERRLLMATNSWKNPASGDWDTAGNWSLGHVPTASEDVVIPASGTYTVRHTTSASDAVLSLTIDEPLNISAGSIEVENGSLTLNSTLTFSSSGSSADLIVNIPSSAETVGGSGTIDFAGTSPSQDEILLINNSTLTIPSGITIEGGGQIAASSASPAYINKGTIESNDSGQTLSITGPVENESTIEAINGANLTISNTSYTNDASGTISVTGGGTLTAGNNQSVLGSNAGTISETNSTLNLGNTFTNTGTISRTGGTVNLTGIYNIDSGAFALTTALGQWFMVGGGFENGTLSFTGSGLLTPTTTTGSLSDITLASNFTIPDNSYVAVSNGLTLNNVTITFTSAGNPCRLNFNVPGSAQTLAGTGTFDFAGTAPSEDEFLLENNSTLTLASGITFEGDGQLTASFSGPAFINKGTINANVPGQTLTINGNVENQATEEATNGGDLNIANTTYANDASGVISVSGGGTLTLGGSGSELASNAGTITETDSTLNLGDTFTNTGTITRTGGTVNLIGTYNLNSGAFTITNALGQWFMLGGGFENGTLSFSGAGALTPTSTQGTFSNLTLDSNLSIPGGGEVEVSNNMTLNAKINLMGSGSSGSRLLFFQGSAGQTLSGNGQIVFAGTASAPDEILSSNDGGALTIGVNIVIKGGNGEIITAFNAPGITNDGIISSDLAGETLTLSSFGLTNNGVLEAAPGTLALSGTYDETGGTITVGIGGTVAGTSYGQITCAGSLTLGGNFNTPLLPGFTPTAGQEFTVITDSGQGGSFTKLLTNVGGGDGFTVSTDATDLKLSATTDGNDFADLISSALTVNGTNSADTINLSRTFDVDDIVMNGTTNVFFSSRITSESVLGNSGNDSITSNLADADLVGNAGDDTIITNSGPATLQGAGGNDSIVSNGGNNSLRGGGNEDTLVGSTGNSIIVGGASNDSITGGSGHDTLAGGPGNDTLAAGSGAESLIGGVGTDSLLGGAGNDTLDATNGVNDTLDGGAGTDSAIGVVAGDSVTNIP